MKNNLIGRVGDRFEHRTYGHIFEVTHFDPETLQGEWALVKASFKVSSFTSFIATSEWSEYDWKYLGNFIKKKKLFNSL